MKQQKVFIISGTSEIEQRLNEAIKENNNNGWYVKQITSHASNRSQWCVLFEKEGNDNEY